MTHAVRLFIAAAAIAAAFSVAAADPMRPGAFVMEELGARATGLGNASTAILDDIAALYSNPAGLTGVDQYQASFGLGKTSNRDLFGSVSCAIPFQRKTTFALGYSRTRTGDNFSEEVSLGNDGDYHLRSRSFGEEQGIADLGVGRYVGRGLSLGAAVRHVSTVSDNPADDYEGLYGRAGIRYNSAVKGIIAGASVSNFGGRLRGAADPDVPLNYAVGFSYGKLISTINYLNVTVDAVKIEGHEIAPRAGVEYWWANYLGLRIGYDGAADVREGNVYGGRIKGGLSVNFRGMMLDLAAVPTSSGFDNTRLEASLRFVFGEERRR